MPVRDQLAGAITVVDLIRHTRSTSTTPVVSTVGGFDLRTYRHAARFLLILSAFETNVANTGGTWAVEDSATSGGTYAAVTGGGGDPLAVAADPPRRAPPPHRAAPPAALHPQPGPAVRPGHLDRHRQLAVDGRLGGRARH